jgi:hypothetical protein
MNSFKMLFKSFSESHSSAKTAIDAKRLLFFLFIIYLVQFNAPPKSTSAKVNLWFFLGFQIVF